MTAFRALLVDPSLFTAPYDGALTGGLVSAGVDPTWAVRPTRRGDRAEIAPQYVDAFFYRHVDGADWLPPPVRALAKGVAHALGLLRLTMRAVSRPPDVVHFQWAVVPLLDALAMRIIKRSCPVVLTVHDTQPFNGEYRSLWQNLAFDLPIRLCDRVIVHTRAGRETLLRRGVPSEKIVVIPHGPLPLPRARRESPRPVDARWTFVLFGEIKHYKGIDILIEALHLVPAALREQAHVIVAGRPQMPMERLLARIEELELESLVEVRAGRLSEEEMAELFERADCFVFPYRQIDASGVYYLVKSLCKWMIATRVGVFAEDLVEGEQGALVPTEDPQALAAAITQALLQRPRPKVVPESAAWAAVGAATREAYQAAAGSGQPGARRPVIRQRSSHGPACVEALPVHEPNPDRVAPARTHS